jgi:hypothetical protein
MITSNTNTKRQTMLAYLQTIMEATVDDAGVAVFKHVELTRTGPPDLETVAYPACFIYSDREYRLEDERSVVGSETWEWYIIIEVWAVESTLEAILEFVHKKIYDNYTLNNNANWAERMGVDFLTIDPAQSLESMAIPFRIVYRHTLGLM